MWLLYHRPIKWSDTLFFIILFDKKGSLTVVYCILGLFGTSIDTTIPPTEDLSLNFHMGTAHSYCSLRHLGLGRS